MHELAITQSIVEAVVDRLGEARIASVRLEIGTLSGVVPDSVRFCFDLVTEGTTLAGARLEIDQPGGRARCRSCAEEFSSDDPIMLCACGSADLDVIAGQELTITAVEVV
ncbi:MAG: hydrogenase maturation nickel metallochaperone HypA [Kutzneria sp.]|nr:hydrogenase maturation nickel metallochaperone HypA [Kutzneria sp.]